MLRSEDVLMNALLTIFMSLGFTLTSLLTGFDNMS